jgi:hypothetical protein
MQSEPCWPKKTAQPQIWGDFLGASSLWLQPWDDSLFKENQDTNIPMFITCICISSLASLPWGHHQSCAIILAALFTCPLYKGLRTERLCNRP